MLRITHFSETPHSVEYILFRLPRIRFPYKQTHLLFSGTTLPIAVLLIQYPDNPFRAGTFPLADKYEAPENALQKTLL